MGFAGSLGAGRQPSRLGAVARLARRVLSDSQLASLAEQGEELTAEVGEKLFEVGDATYPFIAIRRGRSLDHRRRRPRDRPPRPRQLPRRDEPALRTDGLPHRGRHPAPALHRRRPRSPAAAALRGRLALRPAALGFHRAARAAAAASRESGSRSSARATRPRPAACSTSPGASGFPTPGSTPEESEEAAAVLADLAPEEIPLVRLPGGAELRRPSNGQLSRALGSGSSWSNAKRSTCWSSAAGRPDLEPPSTAPRRVSTRWWSRAPCSAARPGPRGGSRTTSASRPGSAAPS